MNIPFDHNVLCLDCEKCASKWEIAWKVNFVPHLLPPDMKDVLYGPNAMNTISNLINIDGMCHACLEQTK
jgi:hypothetical protein